jgi:uncharacterized membrane protein
MAKTKLGMDENLEGAGCYLLGWISGIVLYVLEDENKFIRFHAMQSILVFLPLTILGWLLGGFFGIGAFWGHGYYFLWWGSNIIWVITVILWLILMLKAYMGEKFKLPIVGDIAEKQTK